MKNYRFVEQGASRYVVDDVTSYDQKNEMFKRPFWDPQMLALGERFYRTPVMPKDKPGFRLQDHALVNASWRIENEFAQGVMGGRMGLYEWDWDGQYRFPRVPAGIRLEISDPAAITRDVKKAAVFLGASLVGICKLDRRWLYSPAFLITEEGGKSEHIALPEDTDYAIVVAVEMDYEAIKCSPAHPASAATGAAIPVWPSQPVCWLNSSVVSGIGPFPAATIPPAVSPLPSMPVWEKWHAAAC